MSVMLPDRKRPRCNIFFFLKYNLKNFNLIKYSNGLGYLYYDFEFMSAI